MVRSCYEAVKEMIYTTNDIKAIVKVVADQYDVLEVWLFGSYCDSVPTEESDIDLIVKYGTGCCGLNRIQFMNALEEQLAKKVDVINIDFLPVFLLKMDLNAEGRLIYER